MANYHFVIGIRDKVPVKLSGPDYIVTDNSDYTVTLEPDSEWDGLEAKTIYYVYDNGTSVQNPIVGNQDMMPIIQTSGNVHIGVSAGELHTTQYLSIPLRPSVRRKAGRPVDPPKQEVYDKIMELINKLIEQSDGKFPVAVEVQTIIESGKPDQYKLIMTLDNGETLTTPLPQMGLTPDDVVKLGSGKPSGTPGGNSSSFKQFYIDEATSQLYIRTNSTMPGKYIAVGGILAGAADPYIGEVASVGNIYINTTTKDVLQCQKVVYGVQGEVTATWKVIGSIAHGSGSGITEESDPTVPAWAKAETKPTYTAAEVGARPDTWMPTASEVGALPASTKIPAKTSDLENDSGFITIAVATLLNYYLKSETYAKTETYSQTEVDNLISGLDKRLAAIADSDDTTLDQLSEIVAYIKANKSLIDSITTDKVNVSDIIDNLTTADSKKPLSAAQGKELKTLYDSLPAWAKAEEKPSYSKSEVGLGNVDNVRQYSASNPPPYPVTSVNGQTGAVTVAAAGIGAATTERAEEIAGQAEENKREIVKISQQITDLETEVDGKQPKGNYLTEVPDEYVTETELEAEITDLKAQGVQQTPLYAESVDWLNENGDTSKVYVLPDGYIYAYTKKETATVGGWSENLVPTSIDTDGSIFNGTGYKDEYRLNSSGAVTSQERSTVIGFIPAKKGDKFQITGVRFGTTQSADVYGYVSLYDESKTKIVSQSCDSILGSPNTNNWVVITPLSNSGTILPTDVVTIDFATAQDNVAFVRFSSSIHGNETVNVAKQSGADMVVTKWVEGGTEITEGWNSTGHAFVPADYEERIIDLENGLADAKSDINNLEEKIDKVSISGDATTVFSIPAYAPTPQLPADGSETSDFNSSTITTQDAYDYMDALCDKYTQYITKQTMGKDASGTFDHNRYILSKSYWRAWQRDNYPKMFAWKNDDTVIYSVSVSPRVGDNMYSTPYIGTVYSTVTEVNSAAKTASTRTVNGKVFSRNVEGDIEPTIAYTKPPNGSSVTFANATVYNSSYGTLTTVSEVASGYFVGADGIKYVRYPFEDRKQDKTKQMSVFILSNEHGKNGDDLIPSFVAMRMAKDLCKNTENSFLKWMKENCMITMIPVGNPWGYARYLIDNSSGYYNSNGININRNYDTPGWSTSDTNYGDVETFGTYPGCEVETQHIMNTMQLCKPAVGISMHSPGFAPELKDTEDNAYFIYQGQGFDSARVHKVTETLYSAYSMGGAADVGNAQHYENCGKSPAYIQYVGAVGGLTETVPQESGTNNTHTSIAMEQAYTQMLLFLQTWCEEALEKLS